MWSIPRFLVVVKLIVGQSFASTGVFSIGAIAIVKISGLEVMVRRFGLFGWLAIWRVTIGVRGGPQFSRF